MADVVIIGGGPGGYEAALVGKQLGGQVTLIERRGLGGSAVLTDVVPSKTLIATAEVMTQIGRADELGLRPDRDRAVGETVADTVEVDLALVNERVVQLAVQQSADIEARLTAEGIRIIHGTGRLDGTEAVIATHADGTRERLAADITLVATGARPRELPDARPDGDRILNWTQMYNLTELPRRLIVVGSGVTGAEFASAYNALGVDVVLVSSRDQVLPSEDDDAGRVLQAVFEESGMTIMSRARAVAAAAVGSGVVVTLEDGRTVEGSHVLMAVGAVPNTEGLGLAEAGVATLPSGHIEVDKVSRTSARGVYAAGDCTGVFNLASVAAMQGRIAMWHSLGDAVEPLDLKTVSANVFTAPEIATVGATQGEVDAGLVRAREVVLQLDSNARAKMQGLKDGFVKVFCLPTTGIVIGGVIVAPHASELVHVLSLAVRAKITVDQLAQAFTVYPSLSGSVAEASRRLHGTAGDEQLVY
ncbi:NAD(P)H-quinone dehydrogenase [Propioniciclava coleopterorum]|uniref:NAD(P)H-quinone dehydrogenase n=1 Tax=Propioniciclava coleopterorum TaxID=2714937 RepID=A0A6G7Y3E0_9ACTN|nr:NAD(P)H-quinone dehydrogenase [Propioniciclava coleopterorum]QIK71350.1 NAD(P)H-quinone dehydrogenase [Propioniciclava coleopterorum]